MLAGHEADQDEEAEVSLVHRKGKGGHRVSGSSGGRFLQSPECQGEFGEPQQ